MTPTKQQMKNMALMMILHKSTRPQCHTTILAKTLLLLLFLVGGMGSEAWAVIS